MLKKKILGFGLTKPEFSNKISKSSPVVIPFAEEILTAVFTSLKHLQCKLMIIDNASRFLLCNVNLKTYIHYYSGIIIIIVQLAPFQCIHV